MNPDKNNFNKIEQKQLLNQQILLLEELLTDFSGDKPKDILYSTDQYKGVNINSKWRSSWWSQLNAVIISIEGIIKLPKEIKEKIDFVLDDYEKNQKSTGLVEQINIDEMEKLIKEIIVFLKKEI